MVMIAILVEDASAPPMTDKRPRVSDITFSFFAAFRNLDIFL